MNDWLRDSLISRLLAVLAGGTLNQRVVVVIGLSFVVGSLYYLLLHLWQPLLAMGVGITIVVFAIRDYERTGGASG